MVAEYLSSGKGAIKVAATDESGFERLNKVGATSVITAGTQFSTTVQDQKNINIYGTNKVAAADVIVPTSSPKEGLPGVAIPNGYKFNLPPHKWSLPVRPINVGYQEATFVKHTTMESFHGLRRGRMWFYLGEYDLKKTNQGQVATSKANPKTLTGYTSAPGPSDVATYEAASKAGKPLAGDRNYGFQFLWNPESVSTAVSVNMDVTPTAADRFRSVSGIFLGNSTVSLTLMIDRTNDFACFKGDSKFASLNGNPGAEYWTNYYKAAYPLEDKTIAVSTKVYDIMSKGTMHDLEYLFRTVNGNGAAKNTDWTNLLGRKTADIGFIQPILVGLQLGPDLDNLSYVGWIDSINIVHMAFTETMIPIRSQVSIAFRTMTGTGLVNG